MKEVIPMENEIVPVNFEAPDGGLIKCGQDGDDKEYIASKIPTLTDSQTLDFMKYLFRLIGLDKSSLASPDDHPDYG